MGSVPVPSGGCSVGNITDYLYCGLGNGGKRENGMYLLALFRMRRNHQLMKLTRLHLQYKEQTVTLSFPLCVATFLFLFLPVKRGIVTVASKSSHFMWNEKLPRPC